MQEARGGSGMKWVIREHGNIDRVAGPWLIKRFIDKDAQFIFVPRELMRIPPPVDMEIS